MKLQSKFSHIQRKSEHSNTRELRHGQRKTSLEQNMSNVQDNIERLLLLDYLSSQVSKIIINPTQLQCPQTTVITIKQDIPKATIVDISWQ